MQANRRQSSPFERLGAVAVSKVWRQGGPKPFERRGGHGGPHQPLDDRRMCGVKGVQRGGGCPCLHQPLHVPAPGGGAREQVEGERCAGRWVTTGQPPLCLRNRMRAWRTYGSGRGRVGNHRLYLAHSGSLPPIASSGVHAKCGRSPRQTGGTCGEQHPRQFGGATSRAQHRGTALVRHPGEGVDFAEFPGKLAPGIARIGAAEDLAVDAAGQQEIGVGSVGGQVPDRAVGGHR